VELPSSQPLPSRQGKEESLVSEAERRIRNPRLVAPTIARNFPPLSGRGTPCSALGERRSRCTEPSMWWCRATRAASVTRTPRRNDRSTGGCKNTPQGAENAGQLSTHFTGASSGWGSWTPCARRDTEPPRARRARRGVRAVQAATATVTLDPHGCQARGADPGPIDEVRREEGGRRWAAPARS
jgi:hypothetical protein